MSTKICQEHLVKHFASWANERYGEGRPGGDVRDPELRKEFAQIVKNARKPSGWKRITKYTVGSKADVEGTADRTGLNYAEHFPALVGWTCRVFLLKGSDSIEVALFEKDGVISDEYDDLSD